MENCWVGWVWELENEGLTLNLQWNVVVEEVFGSQHDQLE
jgi:hypothetical protein